MSWKEAVAWHHVLGSLKRSQERLHVQVHPSCNGDPRLEIPAPWEHHQGQPKPRSSANLSCLSALQMAEVRSGAL